RTGGSVMKRRNEENIRQRLQGLSRTKHQEPNRLAFLCAIFVLVSVTSFFAGYILRSVYVTSMGGMILDENKVNILADEIAEKYGLLPDAARQYLNDSIGG
ncbi:MAG: hypothetical protein AAGH90_10645, partial [Pseudomonadota bacterium]